MSTFDNVAYKKLWVGSSLSFENFVVGKANQLAVFAATQVAELEAGKYNPLFIHGGVGLGKSHLIQAIGNQILLSRPQTKVCYLHAERYVADVVRAYQANKFDEFKQFYHSLDVLLIDDVQFLAGRCKTQEELSYMFNALLGAGKRIILSGDTTPNEMSGIELRLISRFNGGLTVAIEPPDLETRASILLLKSNAYRNPIEEEVAFFIAAQVATNIRELDGALKRILAYAEFHKIPVTVASVKEALA